MFIIIESDTAHNGQMNAFCCFMNKTNKIVDNSRKIGDPQNVQSR
jgi:hypothetical protein